MSKYYQDLDEGHFDYALVDLPGLPLSVRGPRIDPSKPYIACIGAAQTFGRFCSHPFPELLGQELGLPVLNLGIGGAGPAFFNRPPLLKWLNSAELVVVQVLSGRSEGNRFFDNSARLGMTGINKLNGEKMRFEKFLEGIVRRWAPAPVRAVVEETRQRYVANATSLLDNIGRPKVLLWLSQRSPHYMEDYSSASGILGDFPHLINRAVLESLRLHADAFVDCTSQAGLPQELWAASKAIDGTRLINGKLFNKYYPSPETHREAASQLSPVCQRLIRQPASPETVEGRPTFAPAPPERFIILGAERSGTSLVRGLLASHPQVCVGGELFNYNLIREKEIHWWAGTGLSVEELNALRTADPAAFVELLFGRAETPTLRALGFKLQYGHAENDRRVRNFLVADRRFRVIHVKRRNLLRRFLSEQRALQTDNWWVRASEPLPENPRVMLAVDRCLADFARIETQRIVYERYFQNHDILEVYYEDVCAGLPAARSRMLAFLGLPDIGPLSIPSQKTGIDTLRDAIENYDELKAGLQDRAQFFDD